MSLIQKRTTEAMVAANRENSLQCTGPVTDAGKLNSRLNALKHGIRARVGGPCLEALGECWEDMEKELGKLEGRFNPYDDHERDLVHQMAENRLRRRRVRRAEAGILAAQGLRYELEYGRKLAGDGRSPGSFGEARLAAALGLAALPDSPAKFNLILQCLRAAQELVEREGFGEEGLKRLETVYGRDPGLAGAALMSDYHRHQAGACSGDVLVAADVGSTGDPEPSPQQAASRPAFMAALETEIACFEKLLDLEENLAERLAAAEWQAQGALSDVDSRRITRHEAFLDRQFEALVREYREWRDTPGNVGAQVEEHLRQSGAAGWDRSAGGSSNVSQPATGRRLGRPRAFPIREDI
ncbi:MAG TPA: hypothetical protein VGW33_01225 [Terriglobia bacterium]|nr:hypothetical protein [Terriglobia bacterium]